MKVKYILTTHVSEVIPNKKDSVTVLNSLYEVKVAKAVQNSLCPDFRMSVEEVTIN